MKHFLYLLTIFLASPLCAAAAPELRLMIDKTSLELGHYSKVDLYGIDLSEKLINIDLRAIERQFGVLFDESAEQVEDPRWPGQSVQLMKLKLYPREVGELILPALTLSGATSRAHTIVVIPGATTVVRKPDSIRRHISISTTEPWERQQIIIMVEIETAEKFVSLRSETLNITGFEVYSIPTSSEKRQQNGIDYSVLRIGWILFPLIEGLRHVTLPVVEYNQFGQTKRKYFLPRQLLNIRALPAYIPPTMPVGKITIASEFQSDKLLFPGELSFWDIQVSGSSVSPSWIPSILRQIESNTAVKIFDESSRKKITATRQQLHSEIVYRVPYKPAASGRLQLPALRLQYFDPVSARISSIEHSPQTVYVISRFLRIMAGIILALLFIWLTKVIYLKMMFVYKRNNLRRNVLAELNMAGSISELRSALKIFAQAEGWSSNMVLGKLAGEWQMKYKADEKFRVLMNELSQACYSEDKLIDCTGFRDELISEVRSIWFRKKYWN